MSASEVRVLSPPGSPAVATTVARLRSLPDQACFSAGFRGHTSRFERWAACDGALVSACGVRRRTILGGRGYAHSRLLHVWPGASMLCGSEPRNPNPRRL